MRPQFVLNPGEPGYFVKTAKDRSKRGAEMTEGD
jgi:hypothetical protein